jgi:hypothetical protein
MRLELGPLMHPARRTIEGTRRGFGLDEQCAFFALVVRAANFSQVTPLVHPSARAVKSTWLRIVLQMRFTFWALIILHRRFYSWVGRITSETNNLPRREKAKEINEVERAYPFARSGARSTSAGV